MRKFWWTIGPQNFRIARILRAKAALIPPSGGVVNLLMKNELNVIQEASMSQPRASQPLSREPASQPLSREPASQPLSAA